MNPKGTDLEIVSNWSINWIKKPGNSSNTIGLVNPINQSPIKNQKN